MTAFKEGDPTTIARLYGRSVGKKLRKYQQGLVDTLLPQISVPSEGPVTSEVLFGDSRPLHFEIGFGGGEHLVHMAAKYRDINILGCEPYMNGVAMLLGKIRRADVTNLAVYPGDARDLMEVVEPGLFAKAFLN